MEFFLTLHPPLKFHKMKTNLFLMMLLLCLTGFSDSANRMIYGTVYDQTDRQPLPGVQVQVAETNLRTTTDLNGKYSISVPSGKTVLVFSYIGYEQQQIKVKKQGNTDVGLKVATTTLNEIVAVGYADQQKAQSALALSQSAAYPATQALHGKVAGMMVRGIRSAPRQLESESYKGFSENRFTDPATTPLSTFAIDVDAASYSNLRRFINNGSMPPKDAVRIEEMINYFTYDLPAPANGAPVAIHTELSSAPWNPQHRLLRIGLKAKTIKTEKLPPANFVFLIDVSGSMSDFNKLPLIKSAMKMLTDQLREKDQVSIVTYAGNAGLRLPVTPGIQHIKIKEAIETLDAGGSTAGGAGIKLAYKIARAHFIKGGNNRIIMATDGDFNVGASSDDDMEQLIAKESRSGVSLSVLGFGMGNIKDSKMETLADKGHGNYAYIDNISEARKSIVTEFGATLFTVAKDVKLQVEFNPAKVQAYRLLGYENRLLEKEDFNNDHKMGGDMGAGHTVTALYEIIPAGIKDSFFGNVDPLKYQKVTKQPAVNMTNELVNIKFRYKTPIGNSSKMEQVAVNDQPLLLSKTSSDFRFASAVAELGMLLRGSDFKQKSDYSNLISRAKSAKGTDEEGYRTEFISLAQSAKLLSKSSGIADQVR
jgi:Ca-activated chloride channel family protein